MWSNTKLLVISSLLIIALGLGFLWFGIKPGVEVEASPSPSPQLANIPTDASFSAVIKQPAIQGVEGERVLVTRVIDGDTIVVNEKLTVRFIGMDTPETVDPRRPVGCFGKEASNETKKLLTGKVVILQKDVSDKDKFARLLRFIYLPLDNGETLFVNDYLVREGYAKVKTYPPDVKFEKEFLEAENQAKQTKKGLWGKCISMVNLKIYEKVSVPIYHVAVINWRSAFLL